MLQRITAALERQPEAAKRFTAAVEKAQEAAA
jgi:ABC-type nitrate/sulfonate/bicarbonate transport system substrate-binding protein